MIEIIDQPMHEQDISWAVEHEQAHSHHPECQHNQAVQHVDHGESLDDHTHSEHCGHLSPHHAEAEIDKPHIHSEQCGHLPYNEVHSHIDHGTETVPLTKHAVGEHVHTANCGHVHHRQALAYIDRQPVAQLPAKEAAVTAQKHEALLQPDQIIQRLAAEELPPVTAPAEEQLKVTTKKPVAQPKTARKMAAVSSAQTAKPIIIAPYKKPVAASKKMPILQPVKASPMIPRSPIALNAVATEKNTEPTRTFLETVLPMTLEEPMTTEKATTEVTLRSVELQIDVPQVTMDTEPVGTPVDTLPVVLDSQPEVTPLLRVAQPEVSPELQAPAEYTTVVAPITAPESLSKVDNLVAEVALLVHELSSSDENLTDVAVEAGIGKLENVLPHLDVADWQQIQKSLETTALSPYMVERLNEVIVAGAHRENQSIKAVLPIAAHDGHLRHLVRAIMTLLQVQQTVGAA